MALCENKCWIIEKYFFSGIDILQVFGFSANVFQVFGFEGNRAFSHIWIQAKYILKSDVLPISKSLIGSKSIIFR